ncbi:protein of unknown function [Bradyrhizobium vignae]|uniref:HTH cro/C1-type domain-containing protein n=2 Tax=Bradyrhizobium vignae TaxID=1549949 RepID=A0A2U3PUR2_9BRAD|nr:protein of unknown function [Bradyrhizobium vignae]
MDEDDVRRYAEGFGVPIKTIAQPDQRKIGQALKTLEAKELKNSEKAKAKRKEVGGRLKLARLARGWDSGSGAARQLKIATQTFLGHENGRNSVSMSAARLYGALLGVRVAWLMDAQLPSGLGRSFDDQLQKGLKLEDIPQYRHLVAPFRAPSSAQISALRAEVREESMPGWLSKDRPDLVREIDASALAELGFEALGSDRCWPFPKGFVRTAFRTSTNALVVVACDKVIGQSRRGDRLVVDTSADVAKAKGEVLTLKRGALGLWKVQDVDFSDAELTVVGQIVAYLSMAVER